MNASIADTLRDRASLQHRQGRRIDAIATYRELLALRPDLTDCWFDLAILLKAEGRFDDALAAYAEALARGVRGPEEVHLNRAVIYADHLRREQDAERELRAALRCRPDYVAARLNLGNLHEEQGDRQRAIDEYQHIVDGLSSGRASELGHRIEALARLAQLRPPSGPDDPVLARLQQFADAPLELDDTVRANLLFSLARAHERLGHYEQAFAAFERANQVARRRGRPYDRMATARAVDQLIATFPAGSQPAAPETGPAPVFICGMYRSGSTLVEQVLAAHPKVTAGGELDLLPRLLAGPLAPFPASIAALGQARAAELAESHRQQLARLFPHWDRDGGLVTDKRPDNFMLIGLVKRLFPHAKIVHTVRNPLDTGLSVFAQHLEQRMLRYASDLGDIGHYYGQYRRIMAHWKALFPDAIHDVDYDALVVDPRAVLQPLFGFLGLDWDERCLAFHQLGNTVKTASYWQVRRPLYGDASGRWRHYRRQLAPLVDALLAAGVDPGAAAEPR